MSHYSHHLVHLAQGLMLASCRPRSASTPERDVFAHEAALQGEDRVCLPACLLAWLLACLPDCLLALALPVLVPALNFRSMECAKRAMTAVSAISMIAQCQTALSRCSIGTSKKPMQRHTRQKILFALHHARIRSSSRMRIRSEVPMYPDTFSCICIVAAACGWILSNRVIEHQNSLSSTAQAAAQAATLYFCVGFSIAISEK